MKIDINNFDVLFIDCDGVLTDNMVYLSDKGIEMARFNRSDGLAFDVIRNKLTCYIISTERNKLVTHRANKLKIKVKQNVKDKKLEILKIVDKNNYNLNKCIYIGNDINDYNAMQLCKLRICPNDSHKKIVDLSDIRLKSNGGEGVVRELVEDIFSLNIKELQNKASTG